MTSIGSLNDYGSNTNNTNPNSSPNEDQQDGDRSSFSGKRLSYRKRTGICSEGRILYGTVDYDLIDWDKHERLLSSYNPELDARNASSLRVILLCAFVAEMSRGILMPSLWLLIEQLGGNTFTLGICMTAFDTGRLGLAISFSQLCETIGYRDVLLISNSLMIFGFLIYTNFLIFGEYNAIATVTAGLFFIGLGAANQGVTRSYICETVPPKERTKYLGYLVGMNYCGVAITPIVGAAISMFYRTFDDNVEAGEIHIQMIDQYTAPAFFLACVSIACVQALCFCFSDVARPVAASLLKEIVTHSERNLENTRTASTRFILKKSGIDPGDFMHPQTVKTFTSSFEFVCKAINVPLQGIFRVFETLVWAYAIDRFQWTPLKLSMVISCCGLASMLYLPCFPVLFNITREINLVFFGMICMSISCALLTPIQKDITENLTDRDVSESFFYVSIGLMYAVGFPVAEMALLGCYSKMVKRGPQGTQQGQFARIGSIAKLFFPLGAGVIVYYLGYNAVFMVAFIILLACCVMFHAFRKEITFVIHS